MTWIDTVVIAIIVMGGIVILYRALKEPIDMMLGILGKGLASLRDSIANRAAGEAYGEIRYG